MKSINSYNKEVSMEESLALAYKEWWKRMIRAVSCPPFPGVYSRFSSFFLFVQ